MDPEKIITAEDRKRMREIVTGIVYGPGGSGFAAEIEELRYRARTIDEIEEQVRVEAEDFADGAWSRPELAKVKDEVLAIMLDDARRSYEANAELSQIESECMKEKMAEAKKGAKEVGTLVGLIGLTKW